MDEVVEDLLDAGERRVLCTHRPVLPLVSAALGLEKLRLDPGEMLVAHHRKGCSSPSSATALTPADPGQPRGPFM